MNARIDAYIAQMLTLIFLILNIYNKHRQICENIFFSIHLIKIHILLS